MALKQLVFSLFILLFIDSSLSVVSKCPPIRTVKDVIDLTGLNGDYCYVYVTTGMDQSSAYEWCRANYRGYLARMSGKRELNTVVRDIQDINTNNVWIDLKCKPATRNCTWSDGSFIGDSMMQQARDLPISTSCGALRNSAGTKYSTWNTITCSSHNNYICQSHAIILDEVLCGKDSFKYKGQCFQLLNSLHDKQTSKSECQRVSGILADLFSEDLIIATTNYLNNEANLPPNQDVWIGSVLNEIVDSEGALITSSSIGKVLVDSYTGWRWHQNVDEATLAYSLCQIGDYFTTTDAVETTAAAATTEAVTTELSRETTKFEAIRPTSTFTETTGLSHYNAPQERDGTVLVIAVLFSAIVLILIAFGIIICCKKDSYIRIRFQNKVSKWPRVHAICCWRFSKNQPTNNNDLPQNLITPLATSESLPNADFNGVDRSSRANHSYFQIGDETGDNVYATIESMNVPSGVDQTYAQIESPRVRTRPALPKTDPPRPKLHRPSLSRDAKSPLTDERKPINSPQRQYSANKETKELSYACLQFAPDEEVMVETGSASGSVTDVGASTVARTIQVDQIGVSSPTFELESTPGMHYAQLLLYDEDEKYQDNTE